MISLRETYGHRTSEGAIFLWEAPILIAKLPFDYVTNVTSRGNSKNLYFHFHKTYGY